MNSPLPSEDAFPALQSKGWAGQPTEEAVRIVRTESGSSGKCAQNAVGLRKAEMSDLDSGITAGDREGVRDT